MSPQSLTPTELNEFQQKTGLNSVPDWAWRKVIPSEEVENYDFYSYLKNSTVIQDVPLQNVVGTDHFSYNNRPWIKMLLNLSRDEIKTVDHAYHAFENPKFAHDIVSFNKYGNKYIIANGNHRACFAKFGRREYVKALVTEYVLDFEALNAYNYLKFYFTASQQGFHFDFDSEFIKVIACDRDELITFYKFFYNLNYKAVLKLKIHKILFNKINNFLLGFINWLLYAKSHMEKKKEKLIFRWSKTPTETNQLIALMEVKRLLDSN